MGRLVAMVCNDPDRLACALEPVKKLLVASARTAGPDAWGIGLYQGGDVLLKRQPQSADAPVDFFEVATGLRTDTFIAHARTPTVGDNRNENTHPFRFRAWLFAHHGTLPGFGPQAGTIDPARPSAAQQALREALVADIPHFLVRNMRGQTDSELLFHLFLSRLHESGHLDIPETRLVDAQAALHRTIKKLDEVLRARGVIGATDFGRFGALALANGRYLLAAARGAELYARYTEGMRDCARCRPEGAVPDRARHTDHDHLRAVMLLADVPAAELDPAYKLSLVQDGTVLAVARDLHVTESALRF